VNTREKRQCLGTIIVALVLGLTGCSTPTSNPSSPPPPQEHTVDVKPLTAVKPSWLKTLNTSQIANVTEESGPTYEQPVTFDISSAKGNALAHKVVTVLQKGHPISGDHFYEINGEKIWWLDLHLKDGRAIHTSPIFEQNSCGPCAHVLDSYKITFSDGSTAYLKDEPGFSLWGLL
jgi:hypothetical protein